MNRKVGALVCIVAGHRWKLAEDAETHAGMTILRCGRCRSESIVSAEVFEAEGGLESLARWSVAKNPYLDPRDDPWFRRRRR